MRRIVHVLSFLACLALLGDAHAAGITSSPTPVKGVPVVTPISTTSTAAVALYVDGALGNDGNACIASGASACLTIQGAIDKIPLFGSGTTTINIAAGTYTENPKIESKNPYQWLPLSASSSFIIVQGATPTVAVASLTVSSVGLDPDTGSTAGTRTANFATAWSADQWEGYFVLGVSGTGAGTTCVISGNTATQLEYACSSTNPFAAASVVSIVAPSTIISGQMILSNTRGVTFNDIKINGGALQPVIQNGAAQYASGPTFSRSQLISSGVIFWSSLGAPSILNCYLQGGGSGAAITPSAGVTTTFQNTYFKNLGLSASGGQTVNLFRCHIRGGNVDIVGATLTVMPAKVEGTVSASNRLRIMGGGRSSGTDSSAITGFVYAGIIVTEGSWAALDSANFVNGLVTQSYSGEVNQIIVEKGSTLNVATTLTMTGAANPILVHSGGRMVVPQTNGLVLAVTCSGATTTGLMLSNDGVINWNAGGGGMTATIASCTNPILIDNASYTVADLSCTASGTPNTICGLRTASGAGFIGDSYNSGPPIALKIGPFVTGQQPTCSVTHRGTFWVMAAAGGLKDTVQVCAKDAGDAYAWRSIY
jgi:hypothetical protein